MAQPGATTVGAQGVLRGLEILEVIAGMQQPAALARIAAGAGMNEAAAYRTLRRLQEQGYVDHITRAGYRIGSRSVALAALVGPDPPLMRAAARALTRLVTTTGHSAALHLRSGDYRVLTVGVPAPSHPLRDEVALGERAPLTSGSAGLAILAHLPQAQIATLLDARPKGERRPTAKELQDIRRDGYLIGGRRHRSLLNGVSAPVLDPESHTPLGSLTIAALAQQAPAGGWTEVTPVLIQVCTELGAQLSALLGPGAARGRRGLDVASHCHHPERQLSPCESPGL